MAKITNPSRIFGGVGITLQQINECTNPDDGSNNQSGFDTSKRTTV
ncbi:hypothetical protein [Chryseobacterium sp.]|nr:hypothetical protein [Chryseobacterium sp.]MBV8326378.1 hypothetical protein [Chryseobacterium sp.]